MCAFAAVWLAKCAPLRRAKKERNGEARQKERQRDARPPPALVVFRDPPFNYRHLFSVWSAYLDQALRQLQVWRSMFSRHARFHIPDAL